MSRDHGLLEHYLKHAWRSTPEPVRRWVPEDRLRAGLAGPVAEAVNRASTGWTPPQLEEGVPIPGTTRDDYRYRFVDVGEGKTFVGGIRFRSGDFSDRFVETYARDYPIESAAVLEETRSAARETLRVFSPTRVRVQVPVGGEEERVVSGPGVTDEYFTVAAPTSHLRRLPPPPHLERVRLEAARNTAFHERYLKAYADVHGERPELRGLVEPEPPEDMERYLKEWSLYEAYVDNEWAGLVGAEGDEIYGLRGYQVVEEVLATGFRGRGLAPAVQRRLIDALPDDGDGILFGTIDAVNAPSLATALRVGRVVVAVSRFVEL